jgi:2Fe-2S ferredoxin
MKLIVTTPDQKTQTLDATPGWRVMEVIKEAGLPMRADCGGCTACATCHVYVDDTWLDKLKPANGEEKNLLDESYVQKPNSRLACQITMSVELDGLTVTISEDAV